MFILTCSQRNNTEIKAFPVFQAYPGSSWRTPPRPPHLTHPPGQRWAAVVPPHLSNPPKTWIWHLGGHFPQEAAKRCLLSHLSKWTWGESRMAHSETCRTGVQAPRGQGPGARMVQRVQGAYCIILGLLFENSEKKFMELSHIDISWQNFKFKKTFHLFQAYVATSLGITST